MSDDADNDGFESGWCTAHIIQCQKNEYGTGSKYQLAVQIFDNAGGQIGYTLKAELVFHVGAVDSDPLSVCYNGDCWTCDGGDGGAHACNVGNGKDNGFEYGDREGDVGFTC